MIPENSNTDKIRQELFGKGRWTFGGDGSHWDGCENVHWDCALVRLTARVAELEAMIDRKSFDKWLVEQLKGNPKMQEEYAKAASDLSDYIEVISKLTARLARLEQAGDAWEEICGHTLQCAVNNLPSEPCDCGFVEQQIAWQRAKEEKVK